MKQNIREKRDMYEEDKLDYFRLFVSFHWR